MKTGEKPDGVTCIGEHPALASLLGPLYGTRSAPQRMARVKTPASGLNTTTVCAP